MSYETASVANAQVATVGDKLASGYRLLLTLEQTNTNRLV